MRPSCKPLQSKKNPARSPASRAGLTYPDCARIKKPIFGQPEIGAQLLSFNLPNNLICGITSSGGRPDVPTPLHGGKTWPRGGQPLRLRLRLGSVI